MVQLEFNVTPVPLAESSATIRKMILTSLTGIGKSLVHLACPRIVAEVVSLP